MNRAVLLQSHLPDARSRRVVFASHCLLNQNVRYLGGACRPGAVDELVDRWRSQDLGICQMACPEQVAWGGVLKRRILPAFGARRTWLWRLRRLVLAAFLAYTRLRYRTLARRVARQVADYESAGFEVVDVAGVAGSPSCGVAQTLDVASWLETVGSFDIETMTTELVNAEAIDANTIPGEGMFIGALRRRLRDRPVHFTEQDLSNPPPSR